MTLYVGQIDGQDIKLDVWPDGTHEVALRDMESRRWGIPVPLRPELVEVRSTPTPAEIVAAALIDEVPC